MKFKINEKVGANYNGQFCQGTVIRIKKILFWNLYLIYFKVNMYDDGIIIFTVGKTRWKFENNLLKISQKSK